MKKPYLEPDAAWISLIVRDRLTDDDPSTDIEGGVSGGEIGGEPSVEDPIPWNPWG